MKKCAAAVVVVAAVAVAVGPAAGAADHSTPIDESERAKRLGALSKPILPNQGSGRDTHHQDKDAGYQY